MSLEVPPDVAYDAAATVAFARRLHDQAGFPNGNLDDRLEPDYAAAERAIAATADAGVDADALAEHLQRQGAGAFTADWATLLTAIKAKAAKPTT